MKAADVRIEYISIDKLIKAPHNPKEHATPEIIASFERFGFVAPVIYNEASGRIVAGHGRLEAATRMRAEGKPAPQRVQVKGKDWQVPVLRGVGFANDAEAEAYLLADNFLSEKGGWEPAELIAALERVKPHGFSGTGFDEKELRRLIAKHQGQTPIPGEDDVIAKAAKAKAKRGGGVPIGNPSRYVR